MLVRRLPAGRQHLVEVCFTDRADGDFAIDGDLEELAARRRGVMLGDWTWLRQVHGSSIVSVTRAGAHAGVEADGAVTTVVDAPLAVQTADCVPVVLIGSGAVGVVHAGWRGVVAGVVDAAVAAMTDEPGTLRALIGPCIRPAGYEFSEQDLTEVEAALGRSVRSTAASGGPALDMAQAAKNSLSRAGVSDVDDLGFDTVDERWFSHRTRREPGRQATVARLVAS